MNKEICLRGIAVLFCIGLSACGRSDLTAQKIYEPFVAAEAPTNETMVVKLPDGTVKIFYIALTKDKLESIASTDHGITWQEPQTEFMLPGQAYYANEVILDQQQELHAVFHILGKGDNGYRGRHYNLWHCKTTGGRTQWTEPKEFFQGYVGSLRGMTQMSSGRLLVSAAIAIPQRAAAPESGPDLGWHDIVTFYSDDNGQTWNLSPDRLVVEQDHTRGLTRYGGIEPHLIPLKDGRIWMLARTKNGVLYGSFSEDGAAWSPLRPTRLISSDSPAASVRLADGRLVLLLNSCQRWDDLKSYAIGGREVLHAAISTDEGKTWSGFREIMRTPEGLSIKRGDRGTAYAGVVQTNTGAVLVSSGQGEGQRQILLFDPDWLTEKQCSTDFTQAYPQWTAYGSQTTQVVDHPDDDQKKALYVCRKAADAPAGVLYNFPMAQGGELQVRIKAASAPGAVRVTLTDHFSVINDTLADNNAIFRFDALALLEQWSEMKIRWDRRKAVVTINDKEIECTSDRDMVWGVNYLRVSCPQEEKTGGFYIENISFAERGNSI